MKNIRMFFAVSLFAFLAFAAAVPCNAAEEPVKAAVDAVLRYFGPVSGTVESVSGDAVSIRLKDGKDVPSGVRLTVFREGDPFYHPVTNEKIGNTEFAAGRIEVKEKEGPGVYTAEMKDGQAEAGDKARLASSKIKLAFFQEKNSDWALSERFYNALKDSGRFEILESYTPSYEREKLADLADDLGAEVVLLFSTPLKKEKKVMDIKLFWASDADMLAGIEKTLDGKAGASPPGGDLFPIELVADEPWNSYSIEAGRMMAVGDVNNNGGKDFAVSDGNSIRIYSLKRSMRKEWEIEGSPSEKHLNISVADLNNNGYAEIFVTSMISERKMSSYVLEYRPSGMVEKIRDNIPYFLRVSGKKLLIQEYGYINKYKGPVYEAVSEDGKYVPGRTLGLPAGVNIYGFTFVDWRESGDPHLLTYDDKGSLFLYDRAGDLLWKSGESYGKPDLSIKRENRDMGDPSAEWYVREELAVLRTGRGQEVFLIRKIPSVKAMPGLGYKETEVISLWWNGSDMETTTVLKGVPGEVNDFQVVDSGLYLIVRGGMFSLVKNSFTGEFIKDSMIYYYNIKGR